jgi:hypothetical protein
VGSVLRSIAVNRSYLIRLFAIFLVSTFSLSANAEIKLDDGIVCVFGFYQYMDEQSPISKEPSSPLHWSFTGLGAANGSYSAAGDTGSVYSFFHDGGDGVSIFLPQGNGAHLFSI